MFVLQHLIHCCLWTEVSADPVFQFSFPLELAITNKDHMLCVVHWRLRAMAHWGVKSFEFEQVLIKTPMACQKLGNMVVQCIESPQRPRLQVWNWPLCPSTCLWELPFTLPHSGNVGPPFFFGWKVYACLFSFGISRSAQKPVSVSETSLLLPVWRSLTLFYRHKIFLWLFFFEASVTPLNCDRRPMLKPTPVRHTAVISWPLTSEVFFFFVLVLQCLTLT